MIFSTLELVTLLQVKHNGVYSYIFVHRLPLFISLTILLFLSYMTSNYSG